MNNSFRSIPSVNKIIVEVLKCEEFKNIDKKLLTKHIRMFLNDLKNNIINSSSLTPEDIIQEYLSLLKKTFSCPLKPVINATGIIVHTNIGRAPYGTKLIDKLSETCTSYTNIEFNLEQGNRAYRDDFLKEILKFTTGSEDAVIVNNNAAAVYLILNQYAKSKEVIISRGELIEIGGSFRIPDIMDNTGALVKEVGTTNITRISDYENAINENTGLIFKAHTSNFTIKGHTEKPTIEDLIILAKKHNIPFVYDAGCGLIKDFSNKTNNLPDFVKDSAESSISDCLDKGVDIICFSGDKVLGSVQSGIILGKGKYLSALKKNPLMRILRVDKFTITSLYYSLFQYSKDDLFLQNIPVFKMMNQSENLLLKKAQVLSEILNQYNVKHKLINSRDKGYPEILSTQIGGGSFPNNFIDTYLIRLELPSNNKSNFIDNIYHELLKQDKPILTILFERTIFLNIYTIDENDFSYIGKIISEAIKTVQL